MPIGVEDVLLIGIVVWFCFALVCSKKQVATQDVLQNSSNPACKFTS